MSEHPLIFSVRGRPVGFVPGRFGGALVAVERGNFPISGTGYRSLAGHFGGSSDDALTGLCPEFLESLAAAQDRTCQTLLARLRRTPRPTRDRLGNFIGACLDAEAALAEGFFATDEKRFALWRGAYRLLRLIDSDARFQPTPTMPAWPAAACAQERANCRALLSFVQRLAAGELPQPPSSTHVAVGAYFELPPKTNGEPVFALPTLTADLPFDLPAQEELEDEDERDEPDTETAEVGEGGPEQMSLF